jgi:hypothetical protein
MLMYQDYVLSYSLSPAMPVEYFRCQGYLAMCSLVSLCFTVDLDQ